MIFKFSHENYVLSWVIKMIFKFSHENYFLKLNHENF